MKTMNTQKEQRSIIIRTLGLLGLLVFTAQASAQLNVAPQNDLQSLVESLAGEGVRIENPSINCHTQGYGEFTYTGSVLGATEGVLLSTGTINNAVGPNTVENRSFQQNTSGDPLLNIVTNRTTYDACRLEFDVIPSGDTLSFDFTFASEEYNEWVGSQYNDVFGFFISGPGITGDPGIGNEKNIALIPNTAQPVTINNVNNGINSQFYHDNVGGSHVQYDGLTKNLKAVSVVQPCQTYRLKLVVADASDRVFDSGVFIQKLKSNSVTMQAITSLGIPELVEGCNPGYVRFIRAEADPTALTLSYYIQGTATNGVDYTAIGDLDPAIAKTLTIPAGATYTDVVVDPIADGIDEGSEYLRFILGNPNCPDAMTDSIDFTIVDHLPVSVSPGNVTICQNGSVSFLAEGGASYSWSPATGLSATNIANPVATPTTTTTYTVTITNGACVRAVQRTVTVSPITLSAVITRPLCNGQSNGAINLAVAGGNAPFVYSWAGPNAFSATTEDLSNIPSGTYTVTVTDANNCSRAQSFNVNTPTPLSATSTSPILIYGQNIACAGGTTGAINLLINGGTAPYAVVWTGPNGFTSTAHNLTGLSAGTYNATITDTNGCTTTVTRTLTEPPPMVPSISDVVHVGCRGENTGTATASITGGMPPYTYSWNTSPVQTSATATGLTAGTRSVTITDGYGCQSTASVIINQPAAALSVSLTGVTNVVQCQGQNNPHGAGTAVPAGGTAPYTYFWNTVPTQTTALAEFNSGGTYSVTVTDANGCTASTDVTVTQPGITSIQLSQLTDVACFGNSTGSATVTVSGGSNIQSIAWNTTPPQTTTTITNVPAGIYNAIAQHANGCQSTVMVTINEPLSALGTPTLSSSSGVACFGDNNGTATLNATGGTEPYTYIFNGDTLSGNTLAGLAAGDHMVAVLDANGCSSQGTFNIAGPTTALTVNIPSYTNVLCTDGTLGTANATATGGTGPYTYVWNTVPEQIGQNAISLWQGTYTVTVTDANGCTASTSVTISGEGEALDGMVEDYGHVSCFGYDDGFATISVTGGSNSYTITWNTVPPQTGSTATGLPPGDYQAEVVDNFNCDTPKYFNITINGPTVALTHTLDVSDYNGWNTSCAGASDGWIDLTVSGGNPPYNYTWSDDFGNAAGMEDPANIGAGTYYISISDAFGCTATDTVIITAPPTLEVSVSLSTYNGDDNVSCAGSDDGSALATITGGTAPYTITWSNNQGFIGSTAEITGLAAGNYDLLVTDSNGCTASSTITLTGPEAIDLSATLSLYNGWNVSCADVTDGSIDLVVMGGLAPFAFEWSNGATSEDLTGITTGSYTVTVTDANDCEATATYVLLAPEALDLGVDVTLLPGGFGTSCASATDGSLTATIDGGVLPYDVAWTGPNAFASTDLAISGLGAGSYTISITDGNDCTTSATVQVTAPAPLNVSVSSTIYNGGYNIGCNGTFTGNISTSITGGIAGYNVEWSGPDGFTSAATDLSGLAAGTYTIAVTDANGCTANSSIMLTEPEILEAELILSDAGAGFNVGCNGNDGSITVNVTGGTNDHDFSWNGPDGFGSTAQNISGLASGTYTLTIMDANGCTVEHGVTLTAPSAITATFVTTSNLCPGANAATIAATLNGGAGNYELQWSGPDDYTSTDAMLTGLSAGNYGLEVTDALGCVATFTALIQDPAPIVSDTYVSFYGQYNLQCAGDSTGVIELAPAGGTSPYTIQVNGPDGFTSNGANMNGLVAGDYLVNITDAYGCEMDTTITLTEPTQTIVATFDISIFPSGTNVSCYGANDGYIEAQVSGGIGPYEIFWRGPDSLEWDMANIYNLPAGDYAYELVVIDANQCSFATEITLTQPDTLIQASSITSDYNGFQVSCADATDGSIELAATGGSGGFTYAWTGPNGDMGATAELSDLAGGVYGVLITDMNGCTLYHPVIMEAPQPLVIDLMAADVTCSGNNDGMIYAAVDGGAGAYQLSWTGPGATVPELLELSGLQPGTYCLTILDANNCSVQECITVTTPEELTASALATNADCGVNNGTVDLSVIGGTAPYAYTWSNGADTPDLMDLGAGTYNVSITDANNCATTASAVVIGTPAVTASAETLDVVCNGDAAGSITLTVITGAAPFTYAWSNGSTAADQSGLLAGSYAVMINDANGCSSEATYTISQSEGLTIDPIVSTYDHGYNVSSYQANDGSISIHVSGGNAPYNYEWSNGQLDQSINNLPAGEYAVEVTDMNGCSATMLFTLTEPTDLEMPNGFSPNGDGANDMFFIRGLDAYPANTFTVFNRWGTVVYDRLNYRNDWAGENSTGQEIPNGTYFVILTVNNGTRTLQGYVDLRR